jgi:hypothetical protein
MAFAAGVVIELLSGVLGYFAGLKCLLLADCFVFSAVALPERTCFVPLPGSSHQRINLDGGGADY